MAAEAHYGDPATRYTAPVVLGARSGQRVADGDALGAVDGSDEMVLSASPDARLPHTVFMHVFLLGLCQ